MTLEFPFEIGQAIWTQTMIDDEWVTTQCEVKSYNVDENGVEVTVRFAGGKTETLNISSVFGNVDIDEEQVNANLLFADRAALMDYLREESLI